MTKKSKPASIVEVESGRALLWCGLSCIYHGSGKVKTSETDAVEELAFQCEILVASYSKNPLFVMSISPVYLYVDVAG